MSLQKLQNMLTNPNFEDGLYGWVLYARPDGTPLVAEVRPGYSGNSAVLISDALATTPRGGINQSFIDVPPNTTFRFVAMLKTIDVQDLKIHFLYHDVFDAEGNWYGGKGGVITGSKDWLLYETTFVTPNVPTKVSVYPALVFNRGEVWIDTVYLEQLAPILHTVTLDSSPVKVFFVQPSGQAPFTTTVADGGKIICEAPPQVLGPPTYNFSHWEVNGVNVGNINPAEIGPLTQDSTIMAIYREEGVPPPPDYRLIVVGAGVVVIVILGVAYVLKKKK